jgi:two-component system OmpR family sensor kinase
MPSGQRADLLLLARLDQGRELEVGPVHRARLATDAVADARVVAPDRPTTVSADSPGLLVVAGDDHRVRQVVANLLTNALVHTPATTPVRVSTRRHADRATLEVADDGPGMDVDAAAHAFDRF